MDPISQASLGAAAAIAVSPRSSVRAAALIGAVAGAFPDIDVLIRSDVDPLLGLEYHRHFTHALLVAPLIGLFVAGLMRFSLFRRGPSFGLQARFGVVAALTHGPLDACTSYGTLLYLPFTSHRESWDVISIIDPIFTVPLVGLVLAAVVGRRAALGRIALVLCLSYLSFGLLQRERATAFAETLAAERGHEPMELAARPSIANIFLWRLVYRAGDHYHVDAVSIGFFRPPRLYAGSAVPVFAPGEESAMFPPDSQMARDIDRFRFFSQGYLARHPDDPTVIGDLRYAILPDSVVPLWGIRIDPTHPDDHVQIEYFRSARRGSVTRLWAMINGRDLGPAQNW